MGRRTRPASEELLKALDEFGYVMKSRNRKVNDEVIREKLEKMTENGVLFPSRDSQTWITLKTRASHKNMDVEDYIRSVIGFEFGSVQRTRTTSASHADARDNHIQVIKYLIDENGKVNGIAKSYPSTYHYLSRFAQNNHCSMSQAINALLDVPEGTYEYTNKSSAFLISNSNFIGNDPDFKKTVENIIRLCMDEQNKLSFIKNAKNVTLVLREIAKKNAMTMQEVVNMFVPEAIIPKHEWVQINDKDVFDLLSMYDDGTGCVDALFNNEPFTNFLRRLAKKHNRTVSEEIRSHGDFYVTRGYYEVDYIDYCKTLLTSYYGEGGDASDLFNRDKRLYYIVSALKTNFPGGALGTIQEVIDALGFDYGGKSQICGSKYHDPEYVKEILMSTFKTTNITESLSYYPTAARALTIYAGKLGLNFVDTLKTLGFEYSYNGGERLKKHLFLTNSEYEKYKQLKAEQVHNAQGEDLVKPSINEECQEKN